MTKSRGQKKLGRPLGSTKTRGLGLRVAAMRDSVVPDDLIADLLGLPIDNGTVTGAARDKLDRWEKPVREGTQRDRASRQALAYANRRLRKIADEAAAAGRSASDHKPSLLAMMDFLRCIGDCLRVDASHGIEPRWLPHHLRADPHPEIEVEIARFQSMLDELERAESRDRRARREAATREVSRLTTLDYERLSATERRSLESALGLDLPSISNHGYISYNEEIGSTSEETSTEAA